MINTIKHLAYILRISMRELLYIINNADKYYHDTKQPKTKYGEEQKDDEGTRYRYLTPSRFSLKRTHERINELLQQIELPSYAFGGIRGKNHFLNAKQHVNSKYFFTVDLKNFFPNISHHQVFRTFIQNRFSPTVSRRLTQLTTFRGKLPQGAPTSPIISNLVFVETGKKLLDFIKDHDIVFTSFYDDLCFSSKKDFKPITPMLPQIIKSGGFYVNYEKVHYRVNRTEITGLMIDRNKFRPMPTIIKRAKMNPFVTRYVTSIYSYQSTISK